MPNTISCRVTAIGAGWIEVERRLPYDVRTKWKVGGRSARMG